MSGKVFVPLIILFIVSTFLGLAGCSSDYAYRDVGGPSGWRDSGAFSRGHSGTGH